MEHKIKFYPVGNADCTLIKLSNGKTIIVDCQIRNAFDDKGNQICYDVKTDLLHELKRDEDGHPFVDLYVSTHPHDDHCVGFGDNFYHGKPEDYDDENNETIIVGELWVTPYGLKNDVCASAADIRREAKRRRKLYDEDEEFEGDYGNYLHILGYDKDKEYDERYGYVPGTLVKEVNGNKLSYLEIFIHAPFKEDVENAKEVKDKNAVSIVMQLSFTVRGAETSVAKVLLGGDAEHQVWQHVLDNNQDDRTLEWDVFQTPHHCSWTFFNDTENKNQVLPSAEDILSRKRDDKAIIVASSEEIKDEEPNPPHYEAKTEYKKRLKKKSNFLNTAVHSVKDEIPQPILLVVSDSGIQDVSAVMEEKEARGFAEALKAGALKVGKLGALSLTTGKAVAASGGFYGEDND